MANPSRSCTTQSNLETLHQEYALVKSCQERNPQAMEQIVHRYETQIYNIAYGMLGNAEDARDITQDVFLNVWQKVTQFRFNSRFSTWLYQIVTNRCRNELVRRRRHRTLPMEMDDSQPWTPLDMQTPERVALVAEQQRMLQDALAKLKPKYREILILREMENLPYEQLAEVLGCSVGRVRSRLHEARMQLRKLLKQMDR